MAYFRGTVRSLTLQMDTLVNVIIPYDYYALDQTPGRYDKTLYLLHGLKQNADAWPRMSGVERYANNYGYFVVIPEVQRSFYTDMASGLPYFQYLTEELPELMRAMFHLPAGRERTYAAGLSMGGYGAMKCALARPDLFRGAMSFSSGFYMLDSPDRLARNYYSREELKGVIGPALERGPEDDLEGLMDHLQGQSCQPRLYVACGTEDPLYDVNLRMRDALQKRKLDLRYEEWPGQHDWRFWDRALERGMAYMAGEEAAPL